MKFLFLIVSLVGPASQMALAQSPQPPLLTVLITQGLVAAGDCRCKNAKKETVSCGEKSQVLVPEFRLIAHPVFGEHSVGSMLDYGTISIDLQNKNKVEHKSINRRIASLNANSSVTRTNTGITQVSDDLVLAISRDDYFKQGSSAAPQATESNAFRVARRGDLISFAIKLKNSADSGNGSTTIICPMKVDARQYYLDPNISSQLY